MVTRDTARNVAAQSPRRPDCSQGHERCFIEDIPADTLLVGNYISYDMEARNAFLTNNGLPTMVREPTAASNRCCDLTIALRVAPPQSIFVTVVNAYSEVVMSEPTSPQVRPRWEQARSGP